MESHSLNCIKRKSCVFGDIQTKFYDKSAKRFFNVYLNGRLAFSNIDLIKYNKMCFDDLNVYCKSWRLTNQNVLFGYMLMALVGGFDRSRFCIQKPRAELVSE